MLQLTIQVLNEIFKNLASAGVVYSFREVKKIIKKL